MQKRRNFLKSTGNAAGALLLASLLNSDNATAGPLHNEGEAVAGDPVPTIGSLEQLRATAPTSSVQTVLLLGYYTPGDGGGGIFIWKNNSGEADNAGTAIKVNNVTQGSWVRMFSGSVNSKWFGAKGDGIADDTRALQNAIDYAAYIAKVNVYVPVGNYKITDTLQLGYGIPNNPYTTITLQGENGSENGAYGTRFLTSFFDRPAFVISGGRQCKIKCVSIIGDARYFHSKGLTFPSSVKNAEDVNTWKNPDWPAVSVSQFSPYAAIAVDAYVGKAEVPYPDIKFPAFIKGASQYGKAYSSDTLIEDIFIEGFTVGIVLTPSGNYGQDDFMRINRLWLQNCIYGISVSHTDSREVSLTNSYISQCHTGITNNAHGAKLGQWTGAIFNCAFDRIIQWFDFGDVGLNRGGPLKFMSCYGEAVWRLGNYGGGPGAQRDCTLILDNCMVNFIQNSAAGIPPTILSVSEKVQCQFIGGSYTEYLGAFSISGLAGNFSFDSVFFENFSVLKQQYEEIANTATCSAVIFNIPGVPNKMNVKYKAWNFNTRQNYVRITSTVTICDNYMIAPFYSRLLSGYKSAAKTVANPSLCGSVAKRDLVAISLSNRDLTLTFRSRDEDIFRKQGPLPGDVITDQLTGSVFFVYSRVGNTVKAKLQNNFRLINGVYSYVIPIDNTASTYGRFHFYNCRVYCPGTYTIGTLTAGSKTITDVGRDDGDASYIKDLISVGSAIWSDSEMDCIVQPSGKNAEILAVDNHSRTITLTGPVVKSEARRQLGIFIHAAPANADA